MESPGCTLDHSRTVFGLGGFTDAQTGATANFQGEIDTFRISPDRRSSATRMP